MTNEFSKVVRIGTVPEYRRNSVDVFCKITFTDGRLSITGVVGPMRNGNCVGSCGQINMSLRPETVTPADGWAADTIAKFFQVWHDWHLNDMRAGSPAQREYLKANGISGEYNTAKESLKAAGLNPDASYLHNGKPYSYGCAWLKEDVPADVLEFLKSLPDTDKKPAWV